MNILLITDRLPYPPNGGGKITMWNLVRRLSERHRVTLATFYDSDQELTSAAVLRKYCVRLETVKRRPRNSWRSFAHMIIHGTSFGVARNYSPTMSRRILSILAADRIDLVQVETFYMAQHVPTDLAIPVVLDMHNVTWLVWERAASTALWPLSFAASIEARRTKRDELSACRRVRMSVVVSDADLKVLRSSAPDLAVRIIAPGIDCNELAPAPVSPVRASVVFVGTLTYLPNLDAVEYFCSRILPLVVTEVPQVQFLVIGSGPARLKRLSVDPHVRIMGMVDDVYPIVQAATVSVVPMRIGGGIRMKILEAMALGSPVVSTTIGCEGLDLRDGVNVLLADTPEAFAAQVVRLLRDSELRARIVLQARATAVQDHTWDRFIALFEDAYRELTTNTGPIQPTPLRPPE